MEIILIIVISLSTIFFGALISLGNERQRKAIDDLRDQTLLWAMMDLKLKREKLAREIRIDDPLAWFGRVISKATGKNLQLQFSGSFEDSMSLIFESEDLREKFVVSPVQPSDLRRMKRRKVGRLSSISGGNPMSNLSRNSMHFELSVLNCGMFFDLELQEAWKGLAGCDLGTVERVWLYETT